MGKKSIHGVDPVLRGGLSISRKAVQGKKGDENTTAQTLRVSITTKKIKELPCILSKVSSNHRENLLVKELPCVPLTVLAM